MATLISMPRLSPTMEEGVVAKWLKQEGDSVAQDENVVESLNANTQSNLLPRPESPEALRSVATVDGLELVI